MSQNRLYALIRDGKANSILVAKNIKFKTNQDKIAYAIYELPVSAINQLTDDKITYRLISHHLSFYEFVDKKHPELSEYHYTAIFKDNNKATYRLHVYFDNKDQLTKEPALAEVKDENFERLACSGELQDALFQFALQHSSATIVSLRQQQVATLSSLEQDFQQAESELCSLSTDLQANREQYLKQLSNTRNILKDLSNYSYNTYHSLDALFAQFEKITKAATNQPKAIDDENDSPAIVTTAPTAPLFFKPAGVIIKKPSADELIKAIVEAAERFSTAQNEADAKQLELFVPYHQSVHEALLLAEKSDMSLTQLKMLQVHLSQLSKHGSRLLTNLLLGNNFTDAAKLTTLNLPAPLKLINMALAVGNGPLLDFLLTNYDFPINTSIVRDNLNPIQFCYYHHSDKTSKKAVFSILVKHKASIMVNAKDGLPVAHHILQADMHPFIDGLIAMQETSKPWFWRNLIKRINDHIVSHPELSDAAQSLLREAIKTYQETKSIVPGKKTRGNIVKTQQTIDAFGTFRSNLKSNMGSDNFAKLDNDPEIIAKKKRERELNLKYHNMLDATRKRQMNLANQDRLSHLNEILKHIDCDTPDAKAQALDYINNRIELLECAIELESIQKVARVTLFKTVKAQKKSLNEQNRLIKKIRELDAVYAVLNPDSRDSKEFMKSQEQELEVEIRFSSNKPDSGNL